MSNKEMVSTETENKGQRKIFLPNKLLECLPRSSSLPNERLRWNTNEEIASYLISFDRHDDWLSCTLKTRPKNGTIILYNRKKVKYRKDGYCWKKRKDGKTTREDHMKLKVQGMECLYGCYVHSSIVPTFHRRCYWLLQNPDIVLVHYLNVPSLEDSGKCSPLLCALTDRHDSMRWSRDELLNQLKPMFHSMKCSVASGDFSIEELVQHILDRQRTKPQPRTHTCLCNTAHVSSGVNIPHRCNSTKHRIISPKLPPTSCRPSPSPLSSEMGGGGGGEAKVPHLQAQSSPASSPCPSSTSASSPPQPQQATIGLGNHSNSFYGDQCGNMTTVALPQNAVIVMATTTTTAIAGRVAGAGGPGGEEAGPRRSLSLTHSGQLLLSPPLAPPIGKPSPPSPLSSSSSSSSPAPPSLSSPAQAPGVATLSLTLLPSPVIGGLILTPSSSSSSHSTSTTTSLRPPPLSATTLAPPSPPFSSSPPPLPPSAPPAFDPDSFLNSPKQGQTYGGPPPSSSSSTPSPLLCSSSPLSPPSLTLSLSPISTPPSSVSPPSSLSSLSSSSPSEGERRDSTLPLCSSSSSPPSSSFPPSLSMVLSPTSSVAPPLLPLCLELGEPEGAREEEGEVRREERQKEDMREDEEGSAPPIKLAHLQPRCLSSDSSPRQQPGSSTTSMLMVCQNPPGPPSQRQSPNQSRQLPDGQQLLVTGQPSNCLAVPEAPPPFQLTNESLVLQQKLNQPSSFAHTKANSSSVCLVSTGTICPAGISLANANSSHATISAVQVKEERRRSYDLEDTNMDTHVEAEADPCEQGGEELDISFDSQFPDLISDLISEEANSVTAHSAAAIVGQNPAVFPAGVRYVVPPQPSPSSSFLPFPHPLPSSSSRFASITDFSPEWSYPEGGVKVLITGPWSEVLGRYSCVFDQSAVPASLIQPGVLRCYCPAHEAGLVCLQVLESGGSVSSSVLFEYRARNASSLPSSQLDWLSLDGQNTGTHTHTHGGIFTTRS
ncbi:calmodulin-binding transcription activator 1-like [Genypterus blacodes]|uniref:calmodulin-binding transcription activator 1-like n=1 Tax=Genypterus blacodes TaxID=154954 RepID=UPI003F76FDA5